MNKYILFIFSLKYVPNFYMESYLVENDKGTEIYKGDSQELKPITHVTLKIETSN